MSLAAQAGRYEILENLGRGATCRVDKARDTIIGRTVAVKTFLQGFGKNSEQQFLTEAQTIGRLSHTSIAQLYDVGTDAYGAPYLVMEYVSGKSLAQLVAHTPVPFAKAAVWAADIASALSYAHRAGVIHGDVTPGNIRVTIDDQVKLVDFGVARFATQSSRSDRVLGTPAYLSPEQIAGQKQDGRSDLFSLGVVLYEMITGFRPFAGDSLGDVCAQILTAEPLPPSKLNPALPQALDRIVARCLAKNPKDRYQSGYQLARALYLVARGRSKSSAKAAYLTSWIGRPANVRDLLPIASAIVLAGSLILGANSLRNWLRQHASEAAAPTQRSSGAPETRDTHKSRLSQAPDAVGAPEGSRSARRPQNLAARTQAQGAKETRSATVAAATSQ
jgi:eukaryotic-like serine/threonine-protein kinase